MVQGTENQGGNEYPLTLGQSLRPVDEQGCDDDFGAVSEFQEGGPSSKKTKSRSNWETISEICTTYHVGDVTTFKELLVRLPNPETQRWFVENFQTRNFEVYVDNQINIDKICYRSLPWEECIKAINFTTYKLNYGAWYTIDKSVEWIERILDYNGIEIKDFVQYIYDVINKTSPKKNAVWFHGPPNSGKTVLALSIASSCLHPFLLDNFNPKSDGRFQLAPAIEARVVLMNEGQVTHEVYDKFLNLWEGLTVGTDRKYAPSQVITRVPFIMTSNTNLWDFVISNQVNVRKQATEVRVRKWNFAQGDYLADCRHPFHPHTWLNLISKYVSLPQQLYSNDIEDYEPTTIGTRSKMQSPHQSDTSGEQKFTIIYMKIILLSYCSDF